ncbi:hypothetical protein [Photobacterium profundum]|uniref:hypothetical protein n=1 Tax=Photobacterium profundum TaxID=74109 RepID=UPI003D0C686F
MANLTVFVSGVTKGSGISKKSGTPKPYSFANVDYLIPAKNFQNDDNDIRKLGMEVKSISMKDDMNLFAQFGSVSFPCQLNLILEANPENPSQNIVVDFADV